MPDLFACSSCGLRFSIGSYHDDEGGCYGLYCRHCGTTYTLRRKIRLELVNFEENQPQPGPQECEIQGPSKIQKVVVPGDWMRFRVAQTPFSNATPPTIKCENCGAEGPFGSSGPITDDTPEGLEIGMCESKEELKGVCPRCKALSLQFVCNWMT